MYLANMRNMLMEQLAESELIVVNRCPDGVDRSGFRRALKVQNPMAQLIFEAVSYTHLDVYKRQAYDGTDYCGWQIQPNGITVEEVLNKKLKKLTGEDIHVIGASRTDSGVHALGNVAVFDTESSIPAERMAYALNQRLPDDIVIVCSKEVPLDWHPRYQDEILKTYEYHIYNAPVPNPLKRRYSTFVSFPMNVEKMREGAAYLLGEHDFVSFCNVRTSVEDTVRTVKELKIEQEGPDITILIIGNGFLYNICLLYTSRCV